MLALRTAAKPAPPIVRAVERVALPELLIIARTTVRGHHSREQATVSPSVPRRRVYISSVRHTVFGIHFSVRNTVIGIHFSA